MESVLHVKEVMMWAVIILGKMILPASLTAGYFGGLSFWLSLILGGSHFGFAVSCVLGSCRAVLAALLCVELGVQGKGPKAIPCGILSCAGGEARLGSCAAL